MPTSAKPRPTTLLVTGLLAVISSAAFAQGGQTAPASARPDITSGASPARPASAAPAPPPVAQNVEFRNGEVALSGTVLLPPNPVVAMVIVHGSGQEKRLMPIAAELALRRVATLTYDKRGVGKSGGVYAGPEVGTNNVDPPNLDLLASDAAAAVSELARRLPNRRPPIGLIGFSQAGWIIPLAATRSPDVKFMILWSGPLVTTREQLRFQFLTDGKSDFWDHNSEAEARQHIKSDPDRYPMTDTDPMASLRKLSIPGLWLYGGRDVSVPTALSIERLQALIAAGKPLEYHLFPNSGHNLRGDEALAVTMEWLMNTVVH